MQCNSRNFGNCVKRKSRNSVFRLLTIWILENFVSGFYFSALKEFFFISASGNLKGCLRLAFVKRYEL